MGWQFINGVPSISSRSESIIEAPTNLLASVVSDTEIDLIWTDSVTISDGVSIERSTDGVSYSEIDTASYGDEAYSDTGLTASTLYYYRIRAYKS